MDRNVTRVNILHNSERLFFARNGTVLRPPQLGFDLRDSRKPAAYPYKWISTLFHTSTYLPNAVEVWPHAQSRLCCPARHHFKAIPDFPTPIARILPVSLNLERAYRRWSPAETLGSQVLPPLSFTACHWPYPGSPPGAFALSFPDGAGLLPINRGSACIPAQRGLSLNQTLPAIPVQSPFTKLHHSLYATACGFGKHPWLGKTRIFCEPPRYRVGARSARVLPHEPAPSLHIQKGN
jgi:hypothetical protein